MARQLKRDARGRFASTGTVRNRRPATAASTPTRATKATAAAAGPARAAGPAKTGKKTMTAAERKYRQARLQMRELSMRAAGRTSTRELRGRTDAGAENIRATVRAYQGAARKVRGMEETRGVRGGPKRSAAAPAEKPAPKPRTRKAAAPAAAAPAEKPARKPRTKKAAEPAAAAPAAKKPRARKSAAPAAAPSRGGAIVRSPGGAIVPVSRARPARQASATAAKPAKTGKKTVSAAEKQYKELRQTVRLRQGALRSDPYYTGAAKGAVTRFESTRGVKGGPKRAVAGKEKPAPKPRARKAPAAAPAEKPARKPRARKAAAPAAAPAAKPARKPRAKKSAASRGGAIVRSPGGAIVRSPGGAIVRSPGGAIVPTSRARSAAPAAPAKRARTSRATGGRGFGASQRPGSITSTLRGVLRTLAQSDAQLAREVAALIGPSRPRKASGVKPAAPATPRKASSVKPAAPKRPRRKPGPKKR